MADPAAVLTDEFIERLAQVAMMAFVDEFPSAICTDIPSKVKKSVKTALRIERDPIHRIVFEVRRASFGDALEHLIREIRHDNWEGRSDIRLLDPGKDT